jgi:hypothetical protein
VTQDNEIIRYELLYQEITLIVIELGATWREKQEERGGN